MIEIRDITKTYTTGDLVQRALDGVSVTFRASEFVAVLGPSGSGKTTFLNILGGFDRADSGDIVVNGVSTRDYGDAEWDAYRNHRVGFIFQSYNLIPHQTLSLIHISLDAAADADFRAADRPQFSACPQFEVSRALCGPRTRPAPQKSACPLFEAGKKRPPPGCEPSGGLRATGLIGARRRVPRRIAYEKYATPLSNSGMNFSPGTFLYRPSPRRSTWPILPNTRPSGLVMPSMHATCLLYTSRCV